MPLFPRFCPLDFFFSASFIFFHCALDIPLGIYSIVIPLPLLVFAEIEDPEKEDNEVKAETCETARSRAETNTIADFIA